MPRAPKAPCCHPGCGALVEGGGPCPAHRQQRERERRARRGPKVYDYRAWRDGIRPQHLRAHPLCAECEQRGRVTAATEVDHVNGDPTNNDPSNLRSLCKSCHSRKTARHDGSFGRERTR